jgi:hypothetical protein
MLNHQGMMRDQTDSNSMDYHYAVCNYTPGQNGQEIKDEDVVPPANHRYAICGDTEVHTWRKKSRAACPTYGTCMTCMNCGLVGQVCMECYNKSGLKTDGFIMIWNDQKIIDSITLMEIFGRNHQKAKADRFNDSNMQRSQQLTTDLLAMITDMLEWKQEITATDALRIKEAYYNLLK